MNDEKDLTVNETFNLAIKNHQEGKTDIAQELYNQVLKNNPNHSQALNNLAVIFTNLKEYQKAKDCYKKAIESDPNYADAHNNLGVVFKELRDDQKAKDCYEKAIELNPNYVNAHYNLGTIFINLGEHQKAKGCYEKAIELNPNYVNAHNNLGTIFINLGEHQKAKECYEKAIEINPNHVNAHNNLATIFQKLGENQKAKECYKKVIKLDPNYLRAHNNLGVLLYDMGDIQKAKSCYEKAIELNPNYANAYNNLGIIFKYLGDRQKAKDFYEKAIELNPNYVDALNNLGVIYKELGDPQKEKNCYEKILKIDPNNINSVNALSILLASYKFDYKSKDDKASFKKLIISLFNKDIEASYISKNAKSILFSDGVQNHLEEAINSDSLLSNRALQGLFKEELFHLLLQKTKSTDILLEKLLTRLRCEILFNLENSDKDNLKKYFNFIISLAEQCWLNEYLYAQSAKEIDLVNKLKQKIENNEKINELQISILSCYMPLNNSKNIIDRLLNYKSSNLLFNDLISVQIKEPLKENELVKSIQSLEEISDPVSKKVQEQYEENPYPRWRCTNKTLSKDFIYWLNEEIEPNKIEYNDKFNNPNILIAGCGTGSHSILGTRYKNSNILAVDLSLMSLAYAKRKTEESNIKNIEYMQADILQLKKLNKKFDIIESVGTLHHMKDPVKGLKVLLDILVPHGFLKLGLYSEAARKHIVEARKFIKRKNYKNTSEDIKICRQDIINEKVNPINQKVILHTDFYSTSSVRDLLFHVQEHRFTIPQISEILNDLNLEFLGFFFLNPLIKKKFSKLFPEDKNNISLDNWHKFEINNPDTFVSMYQFWVRKI